MHNMNIVFWVADMSLPSDFSAVVVPSLSPLSSMKKIFQNNKRQFAIHHSILIQLWTLFQLICQVTAMYAMASWIKKANKLQELVVWAYE